MKVLLLGGHGFVGRNVAAALAATAHEVVVAPGRDRCDLTDLDAARSCIRAAGPDVVVNCAALVGSLNYVTERAAEVLDANLRMLLNIYRSVAEIVPGAVIAHPIANCAFPGDLEIYREDSLWQGAIHRSVLSYGSTRRMMPVMADCYAMQYGLKTLAFFTPNMYGPHDSTDPNKAHALNALCARMVKARAEQAPFIEVWGTGTPVREWLYAPDFARVLCEALDRLADPGLAAPLNIAQQHGLTVRELVELVAAETGYAGQIRWDRNRPDGAPRKVMDSELFRKSFPDFRFTDFQGGVRSTIDYYRSVLPY